MASKYHSESISAKATLCDCMVHDADNGGASVTNNGVAKHVCVD